MAEQFKASIFTIQKLTWRRFESQQAKNKNADSYSFLLSSKLGPSPIYRSCFDVTNICSDHMSRASSATKQNKLSEFPNV